MPLPPPPAAGLIRDGNPTALARSEKVAGSSSSMADGATGKPRAATKARARTLSPMSSIASAVGPTKTRPASADLPREMCVLGKKAVARMDGAGLLSRAAATIWRAVEIGRDRRRSDISIARSAAKTAGVRRRRRDERRRLRAQALERCAKCAMRSRHDWR